MNSNKDTFCGVTGHVLVDSLVILNNEEIKPHEPIYLFKDDEIIEKIKRLKYLAIQNLLMKL